MSDPVSKTLKQSVVGQSLTAVVGQGAIDPDLVLVERLNSSLDSVEKHLATSPLRTEWFLEFKPAGNPAAMAFGKQSGKWQLSARFDDEEGNYRWRALHEMSIVDKAEVAKKLPEYLASYQAEQKRRSGLLLDANRAIDIAVKMLEGA